MKLRKPCFSSIKICLLAITFGGPLISQTSVADVHNPQQTFLQRDLAATDGYTASSTLTNYLDAVVTQPYGTAPSAFTFSQWKNLNQFNSSTPLTAKYFNSADLGLGRNMNCVAQPTLEGARGLGAMACYVSNHGKIGAGSELAFSELNNPNSAEFATVAMEYHPSATRNKVRFFVFDSQANGGKLVTALNIALDNGTGHEQPGLCLACHGGELKNTTSASTIDIQDAHFLPFDIFSLEFETPEKREAALPALNSMNRLIRRAERSANHTNQRIAEYLEGSYSPSIDTQTAPMNDLYTPSTFSGNNNDKYLYHTVVKNYCRTCHLSSSFNLTPAITLAYLCGNQDMPHAEVNEANALRHMAFIAPQIKKTTGSDLCFNKPILIDFQDDLLSDASVNVVGMEAKLSNKTLKAMAGTATATTTTLDGANQQRRTLRIKEKTQRGQVVVSNPTGRQLKNVKLLARTLIPNQAAQPQFGIGWGDTFLSTSTDGSLYSERTPLITNISGSDFASVSSGDLQNVKFLRINDGDSENALPATPKREIELDNLLVFANAPTKPIITEDYEGLGSQVTTLLNFRDTFGCTQTPPAGASNFDGFIIGNSFKVGADSGRYSLHSFPKECAGVILTLQFNNLHTQASNSGIPITDQLLQFDFSYQPTKATAFISSIYDASTHTDLLDHAKANGSLSIVNGVARGRVSIPMTANFSNGLLRAVMLEDSGINGKPAHGIAIDNIMISSRN
jgi:hypothetical protein